MMFLLDMPWSLGFMNLSNGIPADDCRDWKEPNAQSPAVLGTWVTGSFIGLPCFALMWDSPNANYIIYPPSHHHFDGWYVYHPQMNGLWHWVAHMTWFSFDMS